MSDLNKSILSIQNKIKSNVSKKYQQKWTAEAASQCFKKEVEKLNSKMEYLKKDISRIEEDIKDLLTPQLNIMEEQYKIIIETFRISQESLLNQNIHANCVAELVKKNKEEGDKILEEYSGHIQKNKEKLEKSNPAFKILEEKRVELKKAQFSIKMLQYKIQEQMQREKNKFEVQKKMFYQDCIILAETWLEEKKYYEAVTKLEKFKMEQQIRIKKLMDINLQVKEKQTTNNSKKNQQRREETNNSLEKLISKAPGLTSNVDKNSPKSKNSLEDLNQLFSKQSYSKMFPPTQITNNSWHNSNYLASNQYAATSNKIRVLENKLIQSPSKETTAIKKVKTMSQEEKSKALEMKLQKVVQNFKSRSVLQKKKAATCSFSQKEKGKPTEDKKMKIDETPVPSPSPSQHVSQNLNADIQMSEDIQNNILSQDNPLVNMLSQDVTLSEFKEYDSEMRQTKSIECPKSKQVLPEKKAQKNEHPLQTAGNNQKFNHPFAMNSTSGIQDVKFGKNVPLSTLPSTNNNGNCNKAVSETRFINQIEAVPQFSVNNTHSPFILNDAKSGNDNGGVKLPVQTQSSYNFPLQDNGDGTLSDKKFGNQKENNIQHVENSNINNQFSSFSNTNNKIYQENKFNANTPFSLGLSGENMKRQPLPEYNFTQNISTNINPFNRQNIEEKLPEPLDNSLEMRNYADNKGDNKMPMLNESQYNFGNITQFMQTSPIGDYSGGFAMSPEFDNSLMDKNEQTGKVGLRTPFGGGGFSFGFGF